MDSIVVSLLSYVDLATMRTLETFESGVCLEQVYNHTRFCCRRVVPAVELRNCTPEMIELGYFGVKIK
jgi:hypothetical protein